MSTQLTDRPLHDIVLEIMYFQGTDKPADLYPKDILWKIDNPEISERKVIEVLDWLVLHKKVVRYLGRYTLDRHTHLELKANIEQQMHENAKKSGGESYALPKTYYLQPKRKQASKKVKALRFITLGIIILMMLIPLYFFKRQETPISIPENSIAFLEYPTNEDEINKLYISGVFSEEASMKKLAYNLRVQNKNNEKLIRQLDTIQQHNKENITQIINYINNQQHQLEIVSKFKNDLMMYLTIMTTVWVVSFVYIFFKSNY